jgi:hypothetical protein
MTLTKFIKAAIQDKDLRAKLLIDPEEACRDFGLKVLPAGVGSGSFEPGYRATASILQGGYRP